MIDAGEIEKIGEEPFDVKAEVLIAGLMEKGLKPDELVVIPGGSFDRRFSPDVREAGLFKLANGKQLLGFHVTRDGIYDSMPEALFHSQSERPLKNGAEMAAESKKLKNEEKEIRRFFLPFENEIFLQRVHLEVQERETLWRISENLFDEVFPEFWGLDPSAGSKYIPRLALLLHFSHKITGNTRLTAKCLETILDEKVEATFFLDYHPQQVEKNLPGQTLNGLGTSALGVDFICGQVLNMPVATIRFKIGPLQNTPLEDFLEGGKAEKFLRCFYSFFIPAEIEVKTTVSAGEKYRHFTLGEGAEAPVLGYNSTFV